MPRDKFDLSDSEEDDIPSSDLHNAVMIPDRFDFDLRAVASSGHSGASDNPYPAMAKPQIRRSHRRSSMVFDDGRRGSATTTSNGACISLDSNGSNNTSNVGISSSPMAGSTGPIAAQLPSSPYLYSNSEAVNGSTAPLHSSSSYNNLSYYANAESSFISGGDSPISYHTAHSNLGSSPSLLGSTNNSVSHQSDSSLFSSPISYPERNSSHSWKSSPMNAIGGPTSGGFPSSRQPNLPHTPRSTSAGHHPANSSSTPDIAKMRQNSTANSNINSSGNHSSPGQAYPLSSPPGAAAGGISLNSSPLLSTPLKYTRHHHQGTTSGGSHSPVSVYSPSSTAALPNTSAATGNDSSAIATTLPPPSYLLSHNNRYKANNANPIDLTIQTPSSSKQQRSQPIIVSPASVSWRATDPGEWTNERVLQWLEVNKFGPDWIQTFRSRNIQGVQFLSLVNYQNLKKLGPFSTKNEDYDTSPSRFIHNLRKLLNKSTSTNSTTSNEGATTTATSSIDISAAPTTHPEGTPPVIDEIGEILPRNSISVDNSSTSTVSSKVVLDTYDTTTASPLERIISNPIEHNSSYDNFMDFRHNIQPRPRTSQPKQRPMSTFESSSRSSFHGVSILNYNQSDG